MYEFEFREENNSAQLGCIPNLWWSDNTGKCRQEKSTWATLFTDLCRRPIGDVEFPGIDQQNEDLQIPGVNANQVENINLPGVDGKQNESPQTKITDANNDVIDIDDLDIAQPEPNGTPNRIRSEKWKQDRSQSGILLVP